MTPTDGLSWPGGARCAAAITFDVDSESTFFSGLPRDAHRRTSSLSWGAYDRVAIPRILQAYRHLGLKQTFFIPAWCMERHWDVYEEIALDGHEIGQHGYVHEGILPTREQEQLWLERGIETMERLLGRRPAGWRGPLLVFTEHTADLLAAAGFKYDSTLQGDDTPYILRTQAGDLVEMPIEAANDDWPQYVCNYDLDFCRTVRAPHEAIAVWRAEIQATREIGGLWIGTWHPAVSGRPARFAAVVELIEWMQSTGDVWLATLEEIADHVREQIGSENYAPRIDSLPYFTAPDPAALELTGHWDGDTVIGRTAPPWRGTAAEGTAPIVFVDR